MSKTLSKTQIRNLMKHYAITRSECERRIARAGVIYADEGLRFIDDWLEKNP